jgi:hypothetical protein
MSTSKNNIPYSSSDIEKYRKGELSAREMHDLEQAALDDPFLADAIEGLMKHPASPQDLADLHERLDQKVTEDTRHAAIIRIRRRITIAAAVILLLGIGITFLYRYPTQPQPTAQPAAAATAATAKADTSHAFVPEATAANAPLAAAADSTRVAFTQPKVSHAVTTRHPGRALAADSSNLSTAFANAAPPPSAEEIYSTASLVYRGKVLDINNRPLAGASLTLRGIPASSTTTDNEGFFSLNLPPADTTRQLTVSLFGYNRTSLAVNALSYQSASSNVIYLAPNKANLNAVVTEGNASKRIAKEAPATTVASTQQLDTAWVSAAPVIGRPAYLQYLQMTKGILNPDTTFTGTETVSFIVSPDGSLSSFKIEQSLSPAHDAAIIRMITDGPAWHLTLGSAKIRAAVTVNF